MTRELTYTIISNNENDYSEIHTCLEAPHAPITKLTITGLTTLCSIIHIDQNDYIQIGYSKYYFKDSYTNLNSMSLSQLMIELLKDLKIDVSIDNSNRLKFKGENGFQITDASYNVKQITGLYNTEFPISVETAGYSVKSVGFYLSTPILYLISNLGARCFQSKARMLSDQKVVMRINNSFSANFPIISNNVEFTTYVISNSLSDIWFKLVDANFHSIKLLSPIYISATGEGIDSHFGSFIINVPQKEEPKLDSSQ